MIQAIKAIEKVPGKKASKGLNGKDRMELAINKCLEFIREGIAEIKALAKKLKVTIYTARGYLVKLHEKGLIKYIRGQVGGNGRKPQIILIDQ